MAHKGQRGIKRAWNALFYSLDGLKSAWRKEQAFVEESVLFVILAPTALWLGDSGLERAVLLACLFLVMVVELLNSAIEAVVDRFGDEWHELAKQAKDMGSAAVLLALINTVVVWALVIFN